jgi:tetratricopeptide (TPR) repeat protein
MALLSVLASIAGLCGLVVGVWQLRVAVLDRRDAGRARRGERPTGGALPVTAPTGRLPAEVLGRDELLTELRRGLAGRVRRRRGGVWVLAGMGGVGKSTVALRLAVEARERRRRVWWVNASDADSLRGGVLEVLRQVGAPEAVAREVGEGTATAPDRVWQALSGRRGLLILDNADDPGVLAARGSLGPADGTGWIRPGAEPMIVVTTRHTDPSAWGVWARLRVLKPLDDASAAAVLSGLAPQAGDPRGDEALALARRLGGLPLALHLAGTYLTTPFARWRDFADYRQALDGSLAPVAVADLDSARADPRDAVLGTWELSLDALTAQGVGDARGVLCELSCFAAGTPIPGSMPRADASRERLEAVRALATVGLVDVTPERQIVVHPVVADTGRARLLSTYRPRLPAIGGRAVELVVAAAEDLDVERPADWPAWQGLLPHIRVMSLWLAPHLEDDALIALLGVGRKASGALWLDSDRQSAGGEELARAMLAAAARLGDDHPEVLAARHVLATALFSRERPQEAEEILRALAADRRRLLGDTHPDTLHTRDRLADVLLIQGRHEEAEHMYRDLVADQRRVLGAEHPDTLATAVDHAWALGMQGRHEEAERICRRVLDIDRRVLGAEHPRTLDAWSDLARWLGRQGRHDETERMCQEILEVERRVLGAEHPLTLRTGTTLARAIAAGGRRAEAEAMLGDLIEVMKRTLGETYSLTVETEHELAELRRAS